MQYTLVRFDVEEVFQGISGQTHEVWIDPGSFTSCYQEYRLGERYLVFASKSGRSPFDTASMSVAKGQAPSKPIPPGIDPAHPPAIYLAPECNGTRPADYPTIDRDITMLRAARAGQRLPRVLGFVYLYPFRGWPVLDGPELTGAVVTIENEERTLTATSGADGSFSLNDAPTGRYKLTAHLPPFVDDDGSTFLQVPEYGCGSADIPLRTTSVIRGIVLDSLGQPMGGVPVMAAVAGGPEDRAPSIDVKTSADGVFSILGVPDVDVYLSAGPSAPSTELPYRRTYYPDKLSSDSASRLHLDPGEIRTEITLTLGPPLHAGRVKVHVASTDGLPADGISVEALVNGTVQESARTAADGDAKLPCLDGISYEVEALFFPPARPNSRFRPGAVATSAVRVECGPKTQPVQLTVPKTSMGEAPN